MAFQFPLISCYVCLLLASLFAFFFCNNQGSHDLIEPTWCYDFALPPVQNHDSTKKLFSSHNCAWIHIAFYIFNWLFGSTSYLLACWKISFFIFCLHLYSLLFTPTLSPSSFWLFFETSGFTHFYLYFDFYSLILVFPCYIMKVGVCMELFVQYI